MPRIKEDTCAAAAIDTMGPDQVMALMQDYVQVALHAMLADDAVAVMGSMTNVNQANMSVKQKKVLYYINFLDQFVLLKDAVAASQPNPATVTSFIQLVQAVACCVTIIHEKRHERLLSAILGMSLWSCPTAVINEILDLLVNLVVANASFSNTVVQVLVHWFLPPPSSRSEALLGPWQMPDEAAAVQDAVLNAVIRLLTLVPSATTHVVQRCLAAIPHKNHDAAVQCTFLRALAVLSESPSVGPLLRDQLLAAAVEHILGIDVEIRWQDIVDTPGEEEEEPPPEEEEEVELDIFELEGMTELDLNANPEDLRRAHEQAAHEREVAAAERARGGWEAQGATAHPPTGPAPGSEAALQQQQVDAAANKLDCLMELVFAHLQRRCAAGQLPAVWSALMATFDRHLLNTLRSKFTQYLIFYVCYLDMPVGGCSAAFLRLLLSRVFDVSVPTFTRQSAAAYVASFTARAAFLPDVEVLSVVQRLAGFCRDYAARVAALPRGASNGGRSQLVLISSQASRGDDTAAAAPQGSTSSTAIAQHPVFYSTFQGLLYILCYHLERLVLAEQPSQQASQQPGGWRPSGSSSSGARVVSITALVRHSVVPLLHHSGLTPGRVLLPSVLHEFGQQATALGLLAERDRKALVQDTQSSPRCALEMFFPFDPYLLRRSSAPLDLRQSYVRWQHGHARLGATAADKEDGSALAEENDAAMSSDGRDGSSSSSDDVSSASSDQDSDEVPGGGSPGSDNGALYAVRSWPAKRRPGAHADPDINHASGPVNVSGRRAAHSLDGSCALGVSYPSSGMSPMGMSPQYQSYISESHLLTSHDEGARAAARGAAGSLGEPVAMSITPGETFMHTLPSRLGACKH